MGKGKVQEKAITEVAALPTENTYRQNALDLLGNLKVILEARATIEPEEQELIMQLSPLYLEKIQAAELIGEERGRQIGECELVLRLLKKRVGNISPTDQMQIKSLTLAQLEALGEALLDFTGAIDLEQWLNSCS
jgi:predicted transposase YdaD